MTFSYKILLFLVSFFLVSPITFGETLSKEATYYADAFDGGKTANGDRFEQKAYSAAICDVPLGQYLYVSKGSTGVVLDGNDRPNCSRYPGVIDLSREAFRLFAPLSSGRITDVQVTPMGPAPTDRIKGFIPRDAFQHLGVILTSDIPTILFRSEGIEVNGKITTTDTHVLLYVTMSGESSPVSFLVPVKPDRSFQGFLSFPDRVGDAVLVIASGNSFDTDRYTTITLIDETILSYPTFPVEHIRWIPKIFFSEGNSPTIQLPDQIVGAMLMTQGGKRLTFRGGVFIFGDTPFSIGEAKVQISGYRTATRSSLDRITLIPSLFSGTVYLDRTHDTIGGDKITIQQRGSIANFRFRTPTKSKIRGKYYLTLPNGGVKEESFPKTYLSNDGYLKQNILVKGSLLLLQEGSYLLEIVREDGVAYVNKPITKGVIWPIIPPLSDDQITTIRKNKQEVITTTFAGINHQRSNIGRSLIKLDPDLTKIAEAKVNDMIKRGYEGHADPDGNYVDAIAKKLRIDTGGSIGENIGFGTVSDLSLQDGLEESGVHRINMQNPNWTRVGIGYGINRNKVYLVHVFGE